MTPVEMIGVRVEVHVAYDWCEYCGGPIEADAAALFLSTGPIHRICSPCGSKPFAVLGARLDGGK